MKEPSGKLILMHQTNKMLFQPAKHLGSLRLINFK